MAFIGDEGSVVVAGQLWCVPTTRRREGRGETWINCRQNARSGVHGAPTQFDENRWALALRTGQMKSSRQNGPAGELHGACAAVRWRIPRGLPVASRSTRSSPPRLGHRGEVARQGGTDGGSPWRRIDSEGAEAMTWRCSKAARKLRWPTVTSEWTCGTGRRRETWVLALLKAGGELTEAAATAAAASKPMTPVVLQRRARTWGRRGEGFGVARAHRWGDSGGEEERGERW
jgi:hypothetical protein